MCTLCTRKIYIKILMSCFGNFLWSVLFVSCIICPTNYQSNIDNNIVIPRVYNNFYRFRTPVNSQTCWFIRLTNDFSIIRWFPPAGSTAFRIRNPVQVPGIHLSDLNLQTRLDFIKFEGTRVCRGRV